MKTERLTLKMRMVPTRRYAAAASGAMLIFQIAQGAMAQEPSTTSSAELASGNLESSSTQPTRDTSTSVTVIAADSPTTYPVVKLPSGVTYQITQAGSGPKAGTTASLLMHYTLYLEDGTKMESSRDKEIPKPFEFTPGTGMAIKGMDEGTAGMHIGEQRRLSVPANMAYGDKAHGKIPANTPLKFDVELVDIRKSGAPAPTESLP